MTGSGIAPIWPSAGRRATDETAWRSCSIAERTGCVARLLAGFALGWPPFAGLAIHLRRSSPAHQPEENTGEFTNPDEAAGAPPRLRPDQPRSEEHTSELQSHS